MPIVAVTEADDGTLDVVTHDAATAAEASTFLQQLDATSEVVASEVDGPVSALAAPPSDDTRRPEQWALDRVPFEDAWVTSGTGTGIVVAVVDTGISGTHSDLVGRFVPGVDWVVDGRPACTDAHSHGTHVAGIIGAITNNQAGVTGAAPGVKLMPVRVLDQNGSGIVSDVASGIEWAVNHGADVINLSLGGFDAMPTVQAMLQDARDHGVVVVAAGGNCGTGCAPNAPNAPVYPAAYPEAIAVGALALPPGGAPTDPLVRAAFSSANSTIDLSAPGNQILSTYPGNAYVNKSGTSMATPYVSAAAALFLAACQVVRDDNTSAAVDLVITKLTAAANVIDLGAPGRDDEFGFGLIDPDAAVLSGCS